MSMINNTIPVSTALGANKKVIKLQSTGLFQYAGKKVYVLGFRIACHAGMSQTIEAIGSYNWSYFDSCHSTKTYYS